MDWEELDRQWDDAMRLLREHGEDPNELLQDAAKNVEHHRLHPSAVFDFDDYVAPRESAGTVIGVLQAAELPPPNWDDE